MLRYESTHVITFLYELGQTQVCQYLISKGVDRTAINKDGYTPFLLACCSGELDTIQYMIRELGTYIEEENGGGCTALFMAAAGGYTELVSYLLSQGSNPNKVDKHGRKPIDIAKNKEVSTILQEAMMKESLDKTWSRDLDSDSDSDMESRGSDASGKVWYRQRAASDDSFQLESTSSSPEQSMVLSTKSAEEFYFSFDTWSGTLDLSSGPLYKDWRYKEKSDKSDRLEAIKPSSSHGRRRMTNKEMFDQLEAMKSKHLYDDGDNLLCGIVSL